MDHWELPSCNYLGELRVTRTYINNLGLVCDEEGIYTHR